jgi:cobalamin biosynthesis Mg chelatase CobN
MNIISALKAATLGKIETAIAINAIKTRDNGKHITKSDIMAIAATDSKLVKLTQVTNVDLAAKNKNRNIVKVAHTVAIIPHNETVYTSSIKHTAAQDASNSAEAIEAYVPRESKYTHSAEAYAAMTLKTDPSKEYLYTIQDKCTKSIIMDADTGKQMTREEVAELCTPSAAKKIMGDFSTEKTNKKYGISHDVMVRTISINNIVRMEEVKV